MRPQDAAIPVRQQNIGAVDEPKTDGHFRVPLLHLLQLLEELEVAGNDDGLSGGCYLHGCSRSPGKNAMLAVACDRAMMMHGEIESRSGERRPSD